MAMKTAPYGTWESPLTAAAIAKGATSVQDILVDPVTSKIYYLEGRPSQEGRVTIVELVNNTTVKDIIGDGWDARTGVQEYGGAAAAVYNNVVYFSHFKNGRIYRLDLNKGGEPTPVTQMPPPSDHPIYRYACFTIHPVRNDILVAVFEDHTIDEPLKVVTTLVQINTSSGTVSELRKGADFYAQPKFSPDGSRITWQEWYHPDMPWEGGLVYVADVTSSDSKTVELSNVTFVGGEKKKISAAFPSWASDNSLLFTSDQSGYINPWKYEAGGPPAQPVLATPATQDFGMPTWQLNMFPHAFVDEAGRFAVFVTYIDGRNALQLVDCQNPSHARIIESPYVVISYINTISRRNREIVFVGSKFDEEPSIVKLTVKNPEGQLVADFDILKKSESSLGPIDYSAYISNPNPQTLKAHDDSPIHVVFYPPRNPQYAGSSIPGEKPPCVVNVHGGPTGIQEQGLYWNLQYFTTRGYAWLDVNYGGSSGYGREYINRLVDNWGLVDVSDCVEAARALAAAPHNLIDDKRLLIRGRSAGGFTTLASLSIAPDVTAFAAGTSSFGVSSLKGLEENTHKFESHYIWNLLGGSSSEVPDIYKARSPVYHAKNIVSPLLLLQGEVDRVVPKVQSIEIKEEIERNGGKVKYVEYPGEGHGWRKESTIQDALEKELDWYAEVLGFPIENRIG